MVALGDKLIHVIGASSAKKLEEQLGIVTVNDLLRHYPRKYSDGMVVREEGEQLDLEVGEHVTFVDTITHAVVKDMRPQKGKRPRKYLVVTLGERRPEVTATFFNADWMIKDLEPGTKVMLSGEVSYFRKTMQLTHPAFLVLQSASGRKIGTKSMKAIAADADPADVLAAFEREFFPIYAASAKVQSWDVYACVRQVLAVLDPVEDPLPQRVRQRWGLCSEDEALRWMHLAEHVLDRERAKVRLTFDEALGLEWAMVTRRHGTMSQTGPSAPLRTDGLRAALERRLPFELTAGQAEVLDVITTELSDVRPMNRMLQGEVGSGKTIVSVLAMAQMIDADFQCALLAPTEVLAAQHARSIRDVLGPLGRGGELDGVDRATRVVLLTGSMTAQQKRAARAEIASGAAGIVIGTHALIQDTVDFQELGMVVVDEQHRFGVDQRDRLRAKASPDVTPHLLVMTATPIPRTVALTVYGDLETSALRELPRGRQPITTRTIFVREQPTWLPRAWQRIREEVEAGRQAYVVASRIEEPETPTNEAGPPPTTVISALEDLKAGALAGLRLGLMHGRLPADEKDAVMTAFRAGELDVLVCTTVIEVGVDVPNATVMVILDADRFGISQLHQLRGRIGRGQHPSLCLLTTKLSAGSKAADRLRAVANTIDGFELAELDLAERREGDVLGLHQSGLSTSLQLLSLIEHREIIEDARELAESVYGDPAFEPGMAMLAAPFVDNDRAEFLDKA